MGRVIDIRHPAPGAGAARGGFSAPRLALIDVARGGALAAMILFHLVWGLDNFGLAATGVAETAPMRGFAHAIATAFLLIAGLSVALAQRGKFKGAAFRRQFAKVALAAAAVTLVTIFVTPQTPITFGILHAIAVGLLITAAFAKAPWPLTFAIALAMILAPHVFAQPRFDDPALQWLGLGVTPPRTLDWRPVLPWSGVMLMGLALARTPRVQAFLVRCDDFDPSLDPVSRVLNWMGRRSLWIYLAQGPILFGALYLLAKLVGAPDFDFGGERNFVAACESQCAQTGASAPQCRSACACVVDALKTDGQWSDALKGRPAAMQAAQAASKTCARK